MDEMWHLAGEKQNKDRGADFYFLSDLFSSCARLTFFRKSRVSQIYLKTEKFIYHIYFGVNLSMTRMNHEKIEEQPKHSESYSTAQPPSKIPTQRTIRHRLLTIAATMYPKQRMFNLIWPAFLLLVIMEKEAAAFPSAPKANRSRSPQRPTILLMPPGRLVTRSIINNNVNKANQGSLSFRNKQQNFNLRVRRHHSSRETFPSFNTASSIGDDTISDDNDEDYVFITPTDMYTGDPNDHRYSASDWWANVKSLPRSTILRAIQGPVITVMVWSFLVSIIHGLLRRFAPSAQHAMCISSKPHSFLVSALGLLLVFRTNSAYQRFAEGRSIWENILSLSRNISRLACLYEKDLGNERKIRVFRLLGAFP